MEAKNLYTSQCLFPWRTNQQEDSKAAEIVYIGVKTLVDLIKVVSNWITTDIRPEELLILYAAFVEWRMERPQISSVLWGAVEDEKTKLVRRPRA